MSEIGMWVVGGVHPGELDFGLVLTKNGSVLEVSWHSGDLTMSELAPGAEFFSSREKARERYLENRHAMRREALRQK